MVRMIECFACEQKVSSEAKTCPKCGHILKEEKESAWEQMWSARYKGGTLIILFFVFQLFFLFKYNWHELKASFVSLIVVLVLGKLFGKPDS